MHPICRTCLSEVSEDNLLVLTEDTTESLQVKIELSVCVPEILVDVVINPVVCFKCIYALHSAYKFKTLCLQTEERINNYIKNMNPDLKCDLHVQKLEVLNYQSCTTTLNETSINEFCEATTTYGIIDDLHNLLNEELLQNVPKPCEVFVDETRHVKCEADFFDESVTEPQEISDSDEDKKPIILQNETTLKECSVICTKLPDIMFNSKLKIISTTQNINPSTQHQGGDGVVFKCNECAYETSKKRNLKRHNYQHTGVKPFLCNICNYRFSDTSNLKNHMRTHTGEKPYVCKMCPYKTAFSSALNRHITTHNSGEESLKPFACQLCSYRGAVIEQLNGHINRIHSNKNTLKRFDCKKCSYKSSYKHCLIRHIQRKHRGANP